MFMTYKTIEGLYIIQFWIHVLIAMILQILYTSSHDGTYRKEALKCWLLYISPFHPDGHRLSRGYFDCLAQCLWLSIIEYINKNHLKHKRLHILHQLENPISGKQARDLRIDYYIETLLRSNRYHEFRLIKTHPGNNLDLIKLKEERCFLKRLKHHKHSLVPGLSNRPIMKKKFLYISIISLAYTYIIGMLMVLFMIKNSKRMRASKGLKYEPSFLSMKLFFDLFFVVAFYFQRSTLILVSYIVSVIHYREMLRSLKSFISQLTILKVNYQDQSHQEFVLNFKNCDISSILLKAGSDCNRLLLVAYIRLRYIFDSSIMDYFAIAINIITITRIPSTIYDYFFYNQGSKSFFVTVVAGVLSFWNLLLLGIAHGFSHNTSELRRILSMIIALIDPCKRRKSLRTTISSHTKTLWIRMFENETDLVEKFAVHLLNMYRLDPNLWFTVSYYIYIFNWLYSRN